MSGGDVAPDGVAVPSIERWPVAHVDGPGSIVLLKRDQVLSGDPAVCDDAPTSRCALVISNFHGTKLFVMAEPSSAGAAHVFTHVGGRRSGMTPAKTVVAELRESAGAELWFGHDAAYVGAWQRGDLGTVHVFLAALADDDLDLLAPAEDDLDLLALAAARPGARVPCVMETDKFYAHPGVSLADKGAAAAALAATRPNQLLDYVKGITLMRDVAQS